MNTKVTAPEIGRRGEDAALRWLTEQGLHLRERNFRCRRGEIDLVMQDGGIIVFVEVRYRRCSRFGSPAETIDRRKQSRLRIAAQYYLQLHPDAGRAPTRIDVIALRPGTRGMEIEWIKNAM